MFEEAVIAVSLGLALLILVAGYVAVQLASMRPFVVLLTDGKHYKGVVVIDDGRVQEVLTSGRIIIGQHVSKANTK